MVKNAVRKNSYYDSATLMLLTSKVAPSVGGSQNFAVMMGSEANKQIMRDSGLLAKEGELASPNDLVFAVRAESAAAADAALVEALELLTRKDSDKVRSGDARRSCRTVEEALDLMGGADVAVVSLPGQFAHYEVKKLLRSGVNVLLFSDNVSVEHENMLKDLALEKGLLMMGPDCGSAVVNGVGLGFSNKVRRGSVGVVAASGTGMQEVMTLVHNFGGGISQALGTGGRDVKESVGGKMMLRCLDMLDADPETEVVVVVSKPPAASVVEKLADRFERMTKPVVACLLGYAGDDLSSCGCRMASTLTEAAQACLELSCARGRIVQRLDLDEVVLEARSTLSESQRCIRGLYCGGTLSYETQIVIRRVLGEAYSNAPLDDACKLKDSGTSFGHTVLDLGDDEFTVGRPHPMIEPSLRRDRLIREALDPQTAVIVLDVEIGFGANDDAAAVLASEVGEARELLEERGRRVAFFATICGSVDDYQGYDAQRAVLESAGIRVFETNEHMAQAAVSVVR